MSVTIRTPGAVAVGTTSVAVPYPASIAAGDLLILASSVKFPAAATTQTPAGWVKLGESNGGSGADGADTGSVFASVFAKIADGTETGNLTYSVTSGNSSLARMFRYTTSYNLSLEKLTGSDGTAGTNFAVSFASNLQMIADSLILAVSAINTDAYTYSGEAITGSGVTFGTVTEPQDSGTTTGSDVALVVSEHPVTSGAYASPSFSMTASGSAVNAPAGALVLVSIHPLTQTQRAFRLYEDGTESGSVAIDAENTNITRDLTSDSNLQLRVGVQMDGGSGMSTDDYQLQYSLNGGAYTNVTSASSVVKGFNSASLTDAASATQRLSAGSGSFIGGRVSEDGLADNFNFNVAFHGELLYSLTVVSASVSNSDTIDFRVIRNSSATGMTFTVTPRITVSKGGGGGGGDPTPLRALMGMGS